MTKVYLNDPYGLKEPKLTGVTINNPAQLANDAASFICNYLIRANRERFYYAQNLTTHLANALSAITQKEPKLKTIYVSSHEMAWIKHMLEEKGFQPDATHSNYASNENISCPTFDVKVLPFEDIATEVANIHETAIFFISHASRMTGELLDVGAIFKKIKENNKESVVIVDGSQTLGALEPVGVNNTADVYLSLSSKFVGAEPELGFAFLSDSFATTYFSDHKYPAFDATKYAHDLYSLWLSLQNPLYKKDYVAYIKGLKTYATDAIRNVQSNLLFSPSNQTSNFLTINFGSVEKNKKFVTFAAQNGVALSENTGWSIAEPAIPLVRIGLSVRVTKQDIDILTETIRKYIKK